VLKKILRETRQAVNDYKMIEDGDKIAVGISGGKDSSLLLLALDQLAKESKKVKSINFEVIGIHINLGFGEEDMSELNDFFKEKEITLLNYDSKIANILSLYPKNGKIQCSRCSQLKKGAVVKMAKENGCNKVAFAHHGDDAIETLLMNQIYGGRLATFEPKMYLSREEISFIRPFIYCFEEDIRNNTKNLNIPVFKSGCPVDGYTKRASIKKLLQKINEEYPDAKKNLLHSIYNDKQVKLWLPQRDIVKD